MIPVSPGRAGGTGRAREGSHDPARATPTNVAAPGSALPTHPGAATNLKGAIDFGMWVTARGTRQRLTWEPASGLVTLDREPIAVCHDETELRRRLTGWEWHYDRRDGLAWLATQLEGCR